MCIKYIEVSDDYLEYLYEQLPEELRGPWIKSKDMEAREQKKKDVPDVSSSGTSSPSISSAKKMKKERSVNDLVVANSSEAKTIIRSLKSVGKKYVAVEMDGNCLYNAYLSNLIVPEGYDVVKFRKQIAAFGVKNYKFFRDKIHLSGESYESYMRNIASGLSYGERHVLEMVTKMWYTRITIINPHFDAIKIWHDQDLEDSHVILAWNGNDHYVGSCFKEAPYLRLRSLENVIHRKKTSFLVPIKKENIESTSEKSPVKFDNTETDAKTICEDSGTKSDCVVSGTKSDCVDSGTKSDDDAKSVAENLKERDENGNIPELTVSAGQKPNPNETLVPEPVDEVSSTVDSTVHPIQSVDEAVHSVQSPADNSKQGSNIVSGSHEGVGVDVSAHSEVQETVGGDSVDSRPSEDKVGSEENLSYDNPPTPDFRVEDDSYSQCVTPPKKQLVPYYSDISDDSYTKTEEDVVHVKPTVDENVTPTGDGNVTPTGDEKMTPGDENLTHTSDEIETPTGDENATPTDDKNVTHTSDENVTPTENPKTPDDTSTKDDNITTTTTTTTTTTKTDNTKPDEVLKLVDSCILDSASKKTRKRESVLSPKSSNSSRSKKVKVSEELDKFRLFSDDLASLEKYVKKAKKFQTKLRSNLLEMGVTEEDLVLKSGSKVDTTDDEKNVPTSSSHSTPVRGKRQKLTISSSSFPSEKFANDVYDDDDNEIDDDQEMLDNPNVIVVSPQPLDEVEEKVVFKDFRQYITLDAEEGAEKTTTKSPLKVSVDDLKKLGQVAQKVVQTIKKEPEVVMVSPLKHTKSHSTKSHTKSSPEKYSPECILISDGDESDGEINIISDKKADENVFDLAKIKKENVTDEDIAGHSEYMKNVFKKIVTKNKEGRIQCPLKCGSDFKSAANMFKHLDDEVCTKTVTERTTLVCKIKECEHTCVTKAAMKAHELGHFNLKPYDCPVPTCDKSYVQPSSLSNHKHMQHADVYGPFPVSKKHAEETEVKKKKKKKKSKEKEKVKSSIGSKLWDTDDGNDD